MAKIGIKDGLIWGALFGILLVAVQWEWLVNIVTSVSDTVAGWLPSLKDALVIEDINYFPYIVWAVIGAIIGAIIDAT